MTIEAVRAAARLDIAARKAANRILDIHHPERTPPIPLSLILQDSAYKVVRKRDPVSITAFYIRDALGGRLIGLNSRHAPRSQRFALAHAMAHGELHDRELVVCWEVRTPHLEAKNRGVQSHPTAAMERQAHVYALELLLPEQAVHAAVGRRFEDVEHPLRDNLVKHIATEFEVPDAAAAARLIELAIISP